MSIVPLPIRTSLMAMAMIGHLGKGLQGAVGKRPIHSYEGVEQLTVPMFLCRIQVPGWSVCLLLLSLPAVSLQVLHSRGLSLLDPTVGPTTQVVLELPTQNRPLSLIMASSCMGRIIPMTQKAHHLPIFRPDPALIWALSLILGASSPPANFSEWSASAWNKSS